MKLSVDGYKYELALASLIGIQHTRRIHHRRASVHCHGYTQCAGNFLARTTRFNCRFHVYRNTAITMCGNGNRERNQFARFQIKRAFFTRLAECLIALQRFRL